MTQSTAPAKVESFEKRWEETELVGWTGPFEGQAGGHGEPLAVCGQMSPDAAILCSVHTQTTDTD